MNACRGLFVTGTDTNVGKTYVAARILRQLRASLKEFEAVGAYKPVCSGGRPQLEGAGLGDELIWDDIEILKRELDERYSREQICRQRFAAPLAPPRAALKEGRQVDVAQIREGLTAWQAEVQFLLIEGAGGWLAPLTETLSIANFAVECGYPVLIVARLGLGTLNHTLLTIEAVQRRGLPIAGVILNESQPDPEDLSTSSNYEDLASRTDVPILGVLRHGAEFVRPPGRDEIRLRWADVFDFPRTVG